MVEIANNPAVANPFVGKTGQANSRAGNSAMGNLPTGNEPQAAAGAVSLISIEELLENPEAAVVRALDTGIGAKSTGGVDSQGLVEGIDAEGQAALASIAGDVSALVTSSAGQSAARGTLNKSSAAQNAPGVIGQSQARGTAVNIVSTPQGSTVQSKWGDFVSGAAGQGVPIDVNALVQFVLRESYLAVTEDLRFYAEKVKFYNNLKKKIRKDVKRLRNERAKYAGAKKDTVTSLDPPVQLYDFETSFWGDVTADAAAMTAAEQELSGGGATPVEAADRAEIVKGLDPKPPENQKLVTTKGGYTIAAAGTEVNVYSPDGKLMVNVWGDPHFEWDGDLNRNLSGDKSSNFMGDSTFILGDGTKVLMQTKKQGAEYVVGGVQVLSGNDRVSITGNADPVATRDRVAFDIANVDSKNVTSSQDGAVMMLADSGQPYAQSSDGKWYEVKAETWENYQNDRDLDLDTTNALKPTASQSLATLDGASAKARAGGSATTVAQLDAAIANNDELLNSVGDDAQLANVDLQNALQKQQQTLQMMSNMSKMLNDTAMAIIRKIGG